MPGLGVDPPQLVPAFLAGPRIERTERLVEDQELGLGHEGPRQGRAEPLLGRQAARDGGRPGCRSAAQSASRRPVGCALRAGVAAPSGDSRHSRPRSGPARARGPRTPCPRPARAGAAPGPSGHRRRSRRRRAARAPPPAGPASSCPPPRGPAHRSSRPAAARARRRRPRRPRRNRFTSPSRMTRLMVGCGHVRRWSESDWPPSGLDDSQDPAIPLAGPGGPLGAEPFAEPRLAEQPAFGRVRQLFEHLASISRGGESQLEMSQARADGSGASWPARVSTIAIACSPWPLQDLRDRGRRPGRRLGHPADAGSAAIRPVPGPPRRPRAHPGRRPASRPAVPPAGRDRPRSSAPGRAGIGPARSVSPGTSGTTRPDPDDVRRPRWRRLRSRDRGPRREHPDSPATAPARHGLVPTAARPADPDADPRGLDEPGVALRK